MTADIVVFFCLLENADIAPLKKLVEANSSDIGIYSYHTVNNKIEKDETGGTCGTFERWRRAYGVLVVKPDEMKLHEITEDDGRCCTKVHLNLLKPSGYFTYHHV